METALFVLCATGGIVVTASVLKHFMSQGPLTHNQHALILSTGFFLTWLCSFLIPLIPSGKIAQHNGLLWFGVGLSVFVGILTYFITRIILVARSGLKKF